MLRVKRVTQLPFIKSIFILVIALSATVKFSDTSKALQLAQLSDGFNPEQKYMASCFACHSTGAAGAPKVGDGMAVEWGPRLEKGLDAMVANTVNGLNTMPAKGLCFDCTDDDLRAIVEYMIETSQ